MWLHKTVHEETIFWIEKNVHVDGRNLAFLAFTGFVDENLCRTIAKKYDLVAIIGSVTKSTM